MLRGFRNKTKLYGLGAQTAKLEAAGVKVIYDEADRDKCVQSLRTGDFLTVAAISCLASNKADLRWVLIGEDTRTRYKGVFLRGAGIYDLETGAKVKDMAAVEAVLRATEDWANERRKLPLAESRKHGKRGGRPRKKRTDKHTAMIAWGDRKTYPTAKLALASPHMRGWSHSAAARKPPKGLGPRGGLVGRLPKPSTE